MIIGDRITCPPQKRSGVNVAYIYIVYSPTECEVRYVGKTTNPMQRYAAYANPCSRRSGWNCNEVLGRWLLSIRELGEWPVMEVVAICDASEAAMVERSFIESADYPGSKLLNIRHTRSGDFSGARVDRDSYRVWLDRRIEELAIA